MPRSARADDSREFTVYLQQAWPKQTTTNNQIRDINQVFGTSFDDWSDVPNLSIGAQVYWQVAPEWKIGIEADYGAGSISGNEKVATEAGPAKLSFEQRYDIYCDFYAITQWKPRLQSKRLQPFVFGGVGMAYESDETTLTLRNDYIDSHLRVENSGWFPTYTVGIGVDVPFSEQSPWFFEFGGAYVWARMTNKVPARGDLAPAPTVTADTDLTGPNYWLGIGRTF